jgi:translation elongation factor EF-Ts
VADKLTNNVATIGENQQVRRLKHVSVTNGVVPYMHNAAATASARSACSSRSIGSSGRRSEAARQADRDAHRRRFPAGAQR